MTSAYPKRIEELVPRAQQLSRELGKIPSQNRLKAALHVRAERARDVLQVLNESGFDPSAPLPDSDREPVPPIASVPSPNGHHYASSTQANGSGEPEASAESKHTLVRQMWKRWNERHSGPPNAGDTAGEPIPREHTVARWPVILLAAPAFVAIWSAWVGVGELAGFGPVRPLPGIADSITINSAITLPIGMETYAAYALRVWLGDGCPPRARRFAKHSAIAAFVLGGMGQIAYHLMTAANLTSAPWPITAVVSCLPVVVLGFGAALVHLQQPQRGRTEGTR